MDFFDTIKDEMGSDYEDLMQIIGDYLESPRRSELSVINTAEKICERVEQATSDIESASKFVAKPATGQAETSGGISTLQSPGTKEPQCTTVANRTSTTISKRPKPPDDDDVIYVSSELSVPITVDLLTPNFSFSRKRNRRRRTIEEVITLDDSLPEPELPKDANTTVARTKVQIRPQAAEFKSPPSTSENTGLKLNCAVCMDDPIKNEPTTTICGHIFCKKCIFRAIKISRKCPLCNKKINSTTQVHRVYV